jgi:hypothetical protein
MTKEEVFASFLQLVAKHLPEIYKKNKDFQTLPPEAAAKLLLFDLWAIVVRQQFDTG